MERKWLRIKIPVGEETTPWLSDPEWCGQLRAVLGHLDERQRRWVAGLLSLQVGRGGISRLVEITGIHNATQPYVYLRFVAVFTVTYRLPQGHTLL